MLIPYSFARRPPFQSRKGRFARMVKSTGKMHTAVLGIAAVVVLAATLYYLLLVRSGNARPTVSPRGASRADDRKTSGEASAAPLPATRGENRQAATNDSHPPVTGDCELPAVLSDADIEILRAGISANQIYHAQDKFIRNYQPYEEWRDRSRVELAALDVQGLPPETVLARAREMRDQFWHEGGNLSPDAYLHAYRARALLELAYERWPDDVRVGDELVETIQTAHPRWTFAKEGTGETKLNTEAQAKLLEVRAQQFMSLQKEVTAGRQPTWEDFLRTCDLSLLLGTEKDYEKAKEVVQWQIDHSTEGGWTFYRDSLQRKLTLLSQGRDCNIALYTTVKPGRYPHEYVYGRRLPSFQGPGFERRGKIPCHTVKGELITMRDF
jgi:hypothetical protein